MIQFDEYFSDGLVQPPTRFVSATKTTSMFLLVIFSLKSARGAKFCSYVQTFFSPRFLLTGSWDLPNVTKLTCPNLTSEFQQLDLRIFLGARKLEQKSGLAFLIAPSIGVITPLTHLHYRRLITPFVTGRGPPGTLPKIKNKRP